MMLNLDDFYNEKQCCYKDETYLVRDNGSIMRLARENKRVRSLDNQWTFGKLDCKTGYLLINSERVHRIVATAFHDEPVASDLVVDHIDTNRQNNRPENLRWVTKLENILLNPITCKRIENVCGVDIYTFLQHVEKYRDLFSEPNLSWMKSVSSEEAKISFERLKSWAKDSKKSNAKRRISKDIFEVQKQDKTNDYFYQKDDLIDNLCNSLTQGSIQRNWRTPTEFLCCPQNTLDEPLKEYASRLKVGETFSKNQFGKSLMKNFALDNQENTLYVITEQSESFKPYALACITYEDNLFVHTSIGTYFNLNGAEKQFTLSQGLEWTGDDSIDDYC